MLEPGITGSVASGRYWTSEWPWDTSVTMFLPTGLPDAWLHNAPTSPLQYWHHILPSLGEADIPKDLLLGRDAPLSGAAKSHSPPSVV